jgi:hypothetical protein
MKALTFRPGDIVPQSGIYRVEHDAHRLMHECTLLKDARFPRCRKCATVRFELLRPVTSWKILPFRSSSILEEFVEPPPPRIKAV